MSEIEPYYIGTREACLRYSISSIEVARAWARDAGALYQPDPNKKVYYVDTRIMDEIMKTGIGAEKLGTDYAQKSIFVFHNIIKKSNSLGGKRREDAEGTEAHGTIMSDWGTRMRVDVEHELDHRFAGKH